MLFALALACGGGKTCKPSEAKHPKPDDDGYIYADAKCKESDIWLDGEPVDNLDVALKKAGDGSVVTVCDVQFTLPTLEIDGSQCDTRPSITLEGLGLAQFTSSGGDQILRLVGVDAAITGFGWWEGQAETGGSIGIVDSKVVFRGSSFGRAHGGTGGAIHSDAKSSVTLEQCTLSDNKADQGGGIYAEGDLTIVGGEARGNVAGPGGAIYANGPLVIEGMDIHDNLGIKGGAVHGTRSVTLTEVTFTDNEGDEGGAVYATGEVVVTGGSFEGNDAATGGAVYTTDAFSAVDATVRNNDGTAARAVYAGGDITIDGGTWQDNTGIVGERLSIWSESDVELIDVALTMERVHADGELVATDVEGDDAFLSGGTATITDTTLRWSDEVDEGVAVDIAGAAMLEGLTLRGGEGAGEDHIGVAVGDGSTLSTVTATGFGVGLKPKGAVELVQSTFSGNGFGFLARSEVDLSCDEPTRFRDNNKGGLMPRGSVDTCAFTSNAAEGLEVEGVSTISNAWLAANGTGLEIDHHTGTVTVERTLIENNYGVVGGIDIFTDPDGKLVVDVDSCEIVDNDSDYSSDRSVGGMAVPEGSTLNSTNTLWSNDFDADVAVEDTFGWDAFTVGGIGTFSCVGGTGNCN